MFVKKIILSILNRIYYLIYELLLLPKNIYFNFKLLPLCQAKKLPLFFNYGVRIKNTKKGCIIIKSDILERNMIVFGRGGSEAISSNQSSLIHVESNAKIIFYGKAYFHEGINIWIDKRGMVEFGHNFSSNKNFTLFYNDFISFGNDCMLGWNVEIIDSGGHQMIYENVEKKNTSIIRIGNHVWIGANVKICRSVTIGDNSIVAYNSTITKGDFPNNSLIAGYPAKIIKKNVNWNK